jgi:hypothetical protein
MESESGLAYSKQERSVSKYNIPNNRHKLRDLNFCGRKMLHIGLNIKEIGFGCVVYWLRILASGGRYEQDVESLICSAFLAQIRHIQEIKKNKQKNALWLYGCNFLT